MTEKQFQDKVKGYLNQRQIYYEVIWGGGFQASGIPDILMCYKGVFVGLELKVRYNGASELQKAKVEMIRNAGGVGAIVWDSLEPIKDILTSIDLDDVDSVRSKYTTRSDSYRQENPTG